MTEWQVTMIWSVAMVAGYLFGRAHGYFQMADYIRRQREKGSGND